jgi:hypothetical protein
MNYAAILVFTLNGNPNFIEHCDGHGLYPRKNEASFCLPNLTEFGSADAFLPDIAFDNSLQFEPLPSPVGPQKRNRTSLSLSERLRQIGAPRHGSEHACNLMALNVGAPHRERPSCSLRVRPYDTAKNHPRSQHQLLFLLRVFDIHGLRPPAKAAGASPRRSAALDRTSPERYG